MARLSLNYTHTHIYNFVNWEALCTVVTIKGSRVLLSKRTLGNDGNVLSVLSNGNYI